MCHSTVPHPSPPPHLPPVEVGVQEDVTLLLPAPYQLRAPQVAHVSKLYRHVINAGATFTAVCVDNSVYVHYTHPLHSLKIGYTYSTNILELLVDKPNNRMHRTCCNTGAYRGKGMSLFEKLSNHCQTSPVCIQYISAVGNIHTGVT